MAEHNLVQNKPGPSNSAADHAASTSLDVVSALPRSLPIQCSLTVGSVDDPLEAEADTMADTVMRMPEPFVQRKCATCEEEDRVQRKPISSFIQRKGAGGVMAGEAVSAGINSSRGNGQSLDAGTQSFMENRFGADFGNVNIHTGSEAIQMNRQLNARAFTVGSDIYFNDGQYNTNSTEGKHLLAHELTHTIQQGSSASKAPGLIQRSPDGREHDPNFILCFALCELGILPATWRSIVSEIFEVISLEYGHPEYGRDLRHMRRSPEYQSWSAAFSTYSNFNRLAFVLGFLGESRIGPFVIRNAAAQAMRRRILLRLAAMGVAEASVMAASQVIRRVSVVIEVGYATACVGYCAANSAFNRVLDFAQATSEAIASLSSVLEGIGNSITGGISRFFRIAQATMDPANWIIRQLPERSRSLLGIIGSATRLGSPDSFTSYIAHPISTMDLDFSMFSDLAADLNLAMHNRGGFYASVQFNTGFLTGLSPLSLIQMLHDYGIIEYRRSPEEIAEEQLMQQTQN